MKNNEKGNAGTMKVTVLYGDNITASRDRLIKIIAEVKKRGWEVLREPTVTDSLFSANRLFVIEDASKLTAKDLTSDMNLLIWQKGSVPAKLKKILPKNSKYEEFKLPQKLWLFLESLYPGNAKQALELLNEITATEAVEFVFAMIARQMRDLYWVLVSPGSMLIPTWRRGKLKDQATKYELASLNELISKLAQLDMEAKTGQVNLAPSLDLLLAKQLE